MTQVCEDFRKEVEETHRFLSQLPAADWNRETAFKQWTPWDVLAHLHLYDQVSQCSLKGREAFEVERQPLQALFDAGYSNAQLGRDRFRALSAEDLLEFWRSTALELCDEMAQLPPEARLPWFGPDMGAQMFMTARFMETWSHMQAVYDLVGEARTFTDRIRHVVVIGVKTFGWTFANRGEEVPGEAPKVQLNAPSGETWTWNESNTEACVMGSAVDFCFVVTQVRNVADTDLVVEGLTATAWMQKAQCFAGPPVDPPRPGERVSSV